MDSLLLTTGLTLELAKAAGLRYYEQLASRVDSYLVAYDKAHPVTVTCSGSLLCGAAHHHKRSCPSHADYACACWVCMGQRMPAINGVM